VELVKVFSIAQLARVDAYGLILMIVEVAQTIKRNLETCQLLARRARMIGDLLQQLIEIIVGHFVEQVAGTHPEVAFLAETLGIL
jgi:hypothetical protein